MSFSKEDIEWICNNDPTSLKENPTPNVSKEGLDSIRDHINDKREEAFINRSDRRRNQRKGSKVKGTVKVDLSNDDHIKISTDRLNGIDLMAVLGNAFVIVGRNERQSSQDIRDILDSILKVSDPEEDQE